MTQSLRQLEALSCCDFLHRFAQIGTADGIYAAMRKSREVKALHAAMREEIVSESDIDQYVRGILESFVPGEHFIYQLALGAISVACVGVNKAYARKFVAYLDKLRSTEMQLASQIASKALQSIPITIRETFSESSADHEIQFLDRVPRSDAGQTTYLFKEELAYA
ncbi:MAG: hypothetical protein JNK90_18220 [Planctomycetaceae bacterium]|nr:hypothetical protein [Planctomycetaceae bacterium]